MEKKYATQIQQDNYSTHSLIVHQIKPNSKILEFGCGSGGMTNYLKNTLKCSVTIVEYDQNAYTSALQYATDGYCGDAESLEWYQKFQN